MKLTRGLVMAAMSVTLIGTGTGVALAGGGSSPSATQSQVEGSEGADDQAAQDAACAKAGVDPKATNIDYDDETGVCALDNGADNGGEE